MSDNTPVVVRLEDGAEYGLQDAETARRVYPNGEIVRYQDGQPFVTDAADASALSDKTRDELNALAAERGIEGAASLPNKGAVIAAIEDAE